MNRSDIRELASTLDSLGITAQALLGYGGESWVFALDHQLVARVNRPGASAGQVGGRTALLAELEPTAGRLGFSIPQVVESRRIEPYLITIERRLPGRPVSQVLVDLKGEARDALVRAYLQAAASLGDLRLRRPWYGDLLAPDPIRRPTFAAYQEARAHRSLRQAGPDFQEIDAHQLAAAWPGPTQPAFVHLDAFPDNMLAQGEQITAVLDFGASTLIGDRRLDPLAAVAYLDPLISPAITDHDRAVAGEWLELAGLLPLYPAAQQWLAAYWSFAHDDCKLRTWCRQILLA